MNNQPAPGRGQEPGAVRIAPIPAGLTSPGASTAPFVPALSLGELPEGGLRRVSFGDLDILLAHSSAGIAAIDDRCPHQAAPLSIGDLDGCVLECPLHHGRFDLATGDPVQMPTTGGLGPDGVPQPPSSRSGGPAKVDPPGRQFDARRLTRIRRLRYYPVRVRDGRIEVAVPVPA